MKRCLPLFNGFLTLPVLLAILAIVDGCATSEESKRKKELSSLLIHVEAVPGSSGSIVISIFRSSPMKMSIQRDPILDEGNVASAMVVDQPGGFALEVQLNRRGRWVLERTTVTDRGRHLAILSNFGQERWLAAPLITAKISDGKLVFTPDCTREEAERIARGLNNQARKMDQHDNWPFNGPIDK
jgi:hypothetical protein